jgi:hypothetical protein
MGNFFPGTFNSAASCMSAITSVMMGSLKLATRLPNARMLTTLVA